MQWSRARVDVRDAAGELSQADTFREGDIYVTFPFLSTYNPVRGEIT